MKSQYRTLRRFGAIVYGLSITLLILITLAWLAALFSFPIQPIEPIWLLWLVGLPFGKLCVAVADIADQTMTKGGETAIPRDS